MKSKKVKDSVTIVSYLTIPTDSNNSGLVHGGAILRLVDEVSFICASRHSGKRCVTASFDRVDFLEPVHIGELLTFYASVNYVGRTSMEIGVRVEAEDLKTCKKRHTNSCYVTMVALDKKGKPTKVQKIIPQAPNEKKWNKEAKIRRDKRLKNG